MELFEETGERGLALAAVEGGKRLGADALAGELDSRRDPSSAEVLGMGGDRLQRLILRPALESRPAQADGDVGAPRLQFGRFAQRELVALLQQLIRFRVQRRVEDPLVSGRRN